MRKYLCLLLVLFSLLTACSKTEEYIPIPNPTIESVETIPDILPPLSSEPTISNTEPSLPYDNNMQNLETEIEQVIERVDEVKETESIDEELDLEVEEVKPEPNDKDLVKIIDYLPDVVVDLKYATTDNFTGVIIYENNDAYLRYGTLKKLMKVQDELKELGYTLVIWDAYRPTDAQFKLWEVCPNSKYVANPKKGYSSHSRGNTVDITIQTLDGEEVEMPTEFDSFSKLADRDYSDVSKEAKKNSLLLENLMKKHGFKPYSAEWWHYSDTTSYPVKK